MSHDYPESEEQPSLPDLSALSEHEFSEDSAGDDTDVSAGPELILEGGCHCGALRYRVTVRARHALVCNCSICTQKGFLHLIVAAEDLERVCEDDAYATYTFGTHTAQHYFCKTCGVTPWYVPRSHPEGFSVNVRTLDEVKVVGLGGWELEPFDGQRWEEHVDTIR